MRIVENGKEGLILNVSIENTKKCQLLLVSKLLYGNLTYLHW